MNIKLLTSQDVDAWKRIRLEALQNSSESFGSSYEEEVLYTEEDWQKHLENSYVFGIFVNNELVASACYAPLANIKGKHRGIIWGVYTKVAHRKKGFSKLLMQNLITHAQNKVRQLHLSCTTINHQAHSMYEHLGFKIYGTDPKALKIKGKYYDEYLMVLDLVAARDF